ncbi:MMPL family transporter [Aeromicrobium sp. CF4.19]|uniref:MMPL family transporter n=1 Tax=Aeromicrobium sp. CF4.19 TaxID=3373082 RepID=UPI003EE48437
MTTTTRTRPGPSRFVRLAAWSRRHHWTAVIAWIAILVGVVAGSSAVGADYRNDFSMPGTESERVTDLLAEHAPGQEGDSVSVVVQAAAGLDGQQDVIAAMTTALDGLEHVASVQAPDPEAGTVTPDGTVGLGTVQLDAAAGDIPREAKVAVLETAQSFASDDLRVELGGDAVREVEEEAGGGAEAAGMLAALVILLVMFGSLLAAALPLVTALFAVGTTVSVVALASNVLTIPDYTAPVLMLVGLGVGIDYALLIFARFRSEIIAGRDRATAADIALDTAGRSVLFAGATVVIALLGLLTLGLPSLEGMAMAVSLTVLMTMLASLTLLPCLLTVLGGRLERRILARARRAAERGREPGRRWRTLADAVHRRPLPPLIGAVTLLAVLCVPAFGLHLGFADAGNDAPGQTSREAHDLVADSFGPGSNGPLVVVTEGDEADAAAATAALDTHPGVARTTPPQATPDGELFVGLAFPTTSPQDEETTALVESLRDDLPNSTSVGGATAAAVDFADAVADRFALFVGMVVGLSALLLLFVFGSIPIALKAACLNLLSIGASLGVVTLVFNEGWLGVEPGPIESFVPVMIFAIVFGLSMDYEVFLVSRMHEHWQRGRDAATAVREGLATTGGVITAAAAIMIVVFGAFVLSPDRMLQQFGLGLATAVLLDALVIRCLVVPAVMRLLGERAWWAPAWMASRLPTVKVD